MSEKALTVAELIAALRGMPQDLPVMIEGCDCAGNAGSVEHQVWEEKEIIRPNPRPYSREEWVTIHRSGEWDHGKQLLGAIEVRVHDVEVFHCPRCRCALRLVREDPPAPVRPRGPFPELK